MFVATFVNNRAQVHKGGRGAGAGISYKDKEGDSGGEKVPPCLQMEKLVMLSVDHFHHSFI